MRVSPGSRCKRYSQSSWLRTIVYARVGEPQAVDEVMQEVALAAVRQKAPIADPTKDGFFIGISFAVPIKPPAEKPPLVVEHGGRLRFSSLAASPFS